MMDPESAYNDRAIREETEDEEQESTNTMSKSQVKIIQRNRKSQGRYNDYNNNVVTEEAKTLREKDLYSDEDHKAETHRNKEIVVQRYRYESRSQSTAEGADIRIQTASQGVGLQYL